MEDYPRPFIDRARPLVIFSGLADDEETSSLPAKLQNGTVVETRGQGLDGSYGASLRQQLLSFNMNVHTTSERDVRTLSILQLHIRTVGKVGQ